MTDGDPVVVGDERRQAVILEVLARHLLHLGVRPVAVPPVAVVDHLEEVRDPATADFDKGDAQVVEAIEDAGCDSAPSSPSGVPVLKKNGSAHAGAASQTPASIVLAEIVNSLVTVCSDS